MDSYVIKRDGRRELVAFDKVTRRIEKLRKGLDETHIDALRITKRVIEGIYDGVSTQKLDELAAETAATMASHHPDYSRLAARIAISNLHKLTSRSFSNKMKQLYSYQNKPNGSPAPLLSKETYQVIKEHAAQLDEAVDYERDYLYDYFGFKTLERSYLMRLDGKVLERPQDMLMRVAVGIHGDNIKDVLHTYELMSQQWFTHATPTLFHAGTPRPQMSSCFLLSMKEDSIEGIYDTLKQCAKISQSAGGVGLSIQNIRAKGAYIQGTGGVSNGIVPMLRNFDMTARYVDQGGNKRKGSFAIYIEPWHADIFEFLQLKKNHGKEELRARDLFYSLWVPDLFMRRVEAGEKWSLFCPHEAPGLDTSWGEEFEKRYLKYEKEGRAREAIPAQKLWFEIMETQIETGVPYMLYKDHTNRKSNQQNLGTIKSSNLCAEIVEYSSPDEIAVCNLASIAVNRFVRDNHTYDHQKLYDVAYTVTRNLNRIIDGNYYPVEEAKRSNFRHRPIGIGVQGLADAFIGMRYPFDSPEARRLNKDLFETLYFASLTASKDLAKQEGPYETFRPKDGRPAAPASKGILQFDMWGITPDSGRWDWLELKQEIKAHGLRNSLLIALMPTASTSQILGNNECFEPYTSNIYVRRTLSGEFIVVNQHLLKDLVARNLWTEEVKQQLIANNGSVQQIECVPDDLKALYRTAWEVSQRSIIDMAADRAPYICQSQSMNIHMREASIAKLTSMHFHAWRRGLKTGMYYLRTQAAVDPDKVTLEKTIARKAEPSTPAPANNHNNNTAHAQGQQSLPSDSNHHTSSCSTDDPCESCSG